jgi:hypothetical protein
MKRSPWIAMLLALAAAPMLASGQSYEVGQYDYGEGDGPREDAPPVDVSVDLSAPGAAVSFDTFQSGLAPMGDWVFSASYGRVWRPRVAAGWRPYYNGQWVWTNEGWFWSSDEPWAWATYHYGRWAYDPGYGWIWVPGYQWAPAWVSWRFSGDAVGWAPLWPGLSVYVTSYPVFYGAWTFVPCSRFVGYPVQTVAYAPSYVPRFYGSTRPAPPRAALGGMTAPAWGGPPARHVESRIGHPIVPARIVPVASPGAVARPGTVAIYRPDVRQAPPGASRPAWGSGPRPWSAPPARPSAPSAVPDRFRSSPPPGRPPVGRPEGSARPYSPPPGGQAPASRGGPPYGGYGPPARGAPSGGYAPAPRGGSSGGVAPAPRGRPSGAVAPAPRGAPSGGVAPAPRGGGPPAGGGGEHERHR